MNTTRVVELKNREDEAYSGALIVATYSSPLFDGHAGVISIRSYSGNSWNLYMTADEMLEAAKAILEGRAEALDLAGKAQALDLAGK